MSRPARTACRFPNIRRWLEQHNMTQEEMAERMGTTPPTVCNMLGGRTEPRRFIINAVLRVTGMTYEEAFKEADGWS